MTDWLQYVIGPAILLALAEVIRRLGKVNHQVSVNGGTSKIKTVPDRISNLDAKQDANTAALLAAVGGLSAKFDAHLEWSQAETAEIWRAIGRR
ncbi:hypothetical protein [Nocardioides jejuensis]|uniref:Uncharacterized protein n=1 Tax=Nocardioides jejuensis TaxID=2502782 RepID=A0A4R1C046_9ACTN|nr:hypothetical protein [Nocardioides jejuensis]TCJ23015.1 hypothetical protein EPD65_11680 [Nocardioides jejuensis]